LSTAREETLRRRAKPSRTTPTTVIAPATTTLGRAPLVRGDPGSIAPEIDVTTADPTTIRSYPMTVRGDAPASAVPVGSARGDPIDVTGSIQTIAGSRMPMNEPGDFMTDDRMPMNEPDDFITEDRMPMTDPLTVVPDPIVRASASEESFRCSAKDIPSVDQSPRSPPLDPTRSRAGITSSTMSSTRSHQGIPCPIASPTRLRESIRCPDPRRRGRHHHGRESSFGF
jgi:hypothetical protein